MRKRAKIELCTATALFIAIAGGATIARGHLVDDVLVLVLAPLLAAAVAVVARSASTPP